MLGIRILMLDKRLVINNLYLVKLITSKYLLIIL